MSKKILNWIIPAIVGVVFGVLSGLYSRGAAHAAVELRPNLAEMGFIGAAMANHGGDWLWYHYPTPMMIIQVTVLTVFAVAAWRVK